MKKILILLICVFSMNSLFAQHKDIFGKWILIRTLYNNGDKLELDHKLYSTFTILDILPYSIRDNGMEFMVKYSKHQIKTSVRTINYKLKNQYLVTFDEGDNTVNIYQRLEDFLKLNPEFTMKMVYRNGDFVKIDNGFNNYIFNHKTSFNSFMSKIFNPKFPKEIKNSEFEFILTKDNQVKDFKILSSLNEEFDKEYYRCFQKSEKYFKNLSNSDLLITKTINFGRPYKKKLNKEESKLFQILKKGNEYFSKHDFNNVISTFNEIQSLDIDFDYYNPEISKAYFKMALCYITLGNYDEACNIIYSFGDKTNLSIRNYILDYCEKNVDDLHFTEE